MKTVQECLVLVILFCVVYSYLDLRCPYPSERRYRSRWFCNGLSTEKYACLYNSIRKKLEESCRFEPLISGEGKEYQIRVFPDPVSCQNPQRYQPFPLRSNISSECVLLKSTCSDEGQYMFHHGSSTNDHRCGCDFQKGFGFVHKVERQCDCNPSKEDCSCYMKKNNCLSGFKLSSDYTCIHNDNKIHESKCPGFGPDRTRNDTQLFRLHPKNKTEDNGARISKIVPTILTVICIIYVICVLAFLLTNKIPKCLIQEISYPFYLKACQEGCFLKLAWSKESEKEPTNRIQKFKIYYTHNDNWDDYQHEMVTADQLHYYFSKLLPSKTYRFKVAACLNNLMESQCSEEETFVTGLPEQPQYFNAYKHNVEDNRNSCSVLLKWAAPGNTLIDIDNYFIRFTTNNWETCEEKLLPCDIYEYVIQNAQQHVHYLFEIVSISNKVCSIPLNRIYSTKHDTYQSGVEFDVKAYMDFSMDCFKAEFHKLFQDTFNGIPGVQTLQDTFLSKGSITLEFTSDGFDEEKVLQVTLENTFEAGEKGPRKKNFKKFWFKRLHASYSPINETDCQPRNLPAIESVPGLHPVIVLAKEDCETASFSRIRKKEFQPMYLSGIEPVLGLDLHSVNVLAEEDCEIASFSHINEEFQPVPLPELEYKQSVKRCRSNSLPLLHSTKEDMKGGKDMGNVFLRLNRIETTDQEDVDMRQTKRVSETTESTPQVSEETTAKVQVLERKIMGHSFLRSNRIKPITQHDVGMWKKHHNRVIETTALKIRLSGRKKPKTQALKRKTLKIRLWGRRKTKQPDLDKLEINKNRFGKIRGKNIRSRTKKPTFSHTTFINVLEAEDENKIDYDSDSTRQNHKSIQKVIEHKCSTTIPYVSRSSSLSQLNMSLVQDNKIEKEWFYKLNVTCDNYSLHLINDFNIERKLNGLSKAEQCKGHFKLTVECSKHKKSTTAFEKMYLHMIGSKHLPMSECIKQDFDLAARFLLARNIAPAELCEYLHETMIENRNNISKAIGWRITRKFYKVIQAKDNINIVIDVWPSFRCRCERHRGKGHSKICSTEPIIIVEVDQFSNAIPKDFHGIPIKQSFQELEDANTKVQCHEEKTDTSSFMDSVKQTPVSIPGELAEMCFEQHSKITMIHIHPFRRTSIQIWAQIKGVIPMGEKHFPKTINGLDTSIAEGHVKFMAKIKIGDIIGIPGSSGTLGGFVQMHGHNAFLTCAHVVHNKEILIAGNKRERHKFKTKVFCSDTLNPNLNVECGFVFSEVFDVNNSSEISIDAAVVIIDEEKVKFDENDILNKKPSDRISVDFLGMKGPYLNDNYITPKTLSGTVRAKYVGLNSGYVESNVTFEDYDKDEDKFKNEPHGLCLYFKELQTHLQDIESECPKPAETPIEVYFQQLVVPKLDEVMKSGRHFFRCYNQLLFDDILFKPGDSGTCIYVVEDKTIVRPDNQPNPTGCLAMAIASFYDSHKKRNKCIATPMQAILKKLNLI